jgi:uroporphyrinogen III methyltransferase/synthase
VARDQVPAGLARRDARVDVVEAYRTVAPEHLAARVREVLESCPDCVTFTSSSTVLNLVQVFGSEALRGIAVASIGPITTQTARGLGVDVTTQAKVYTVEGLVAAVLGLYTEMTPPSEG